MEIKSAENLENYLLIAIILITRKLTQAIMEISATMGAKWRALMRTARVMVLRSV